ncbi:MAG: hypothetical protein CMO81_03350 [Waddliaceae bacterium]|nr:hypothetical protein [Waddliaceae bacterium]
MIKPGFKLLSLFAIGLTLSLGSLTADSVPDVSPVQSTANPLGLQTVGPVNLAGSDFRSASFLTNLPNIMSYIDDHRDLLGRYRPPTNSRIDPNGLSWNTDMDVRVYFVDESSILHNSIGHTTNSDFSLNWGDEKLIFPDASTNGSTRTNSWPGSLGTPVLPGDFVELGTIPAWTPLDFFAIPNGGAQAGHEQNITLTYWTDPDQNSLGDPVQHFFTVNPIPGTDYLLYALEDLPFGAFGDYDDVFFIVEAVATPEPETYLILGAFLLMVIAIRGKEPLKARVKI